MKRYDEYKDSGVEWIGEVPSHWEVVPLKRAITINNGCDYKHVQVEEDGYPVIGSGGQFAWANQYMYDGEAVLLGRKGTIDKPMYYNGKFWTVDTMFYGIPKKNANCKYLYYQAKNIPFERYATATALPSMTQTDLNNNTICLPPLDEQIVIATYLDKKCSEIDNVISAQQKRIALLQELKQSVITHAVTKGLNPNVEMKDAEVDWIDRLPVSWKMAKLKYYIHLINGRAYSQPELLPEGKYKVLRVGNFFTNDTWYYSNMELEEDKYCNNGDLLYAWSASFGPYIWNQDKTIYHYHIWKVCYKECMDKMYVYYMLKAITNFKLGDIHGSTMVHITMESMNNSIIPIPSFDEQKNIASYLNKKCASIDSSISKALHQVELLQEYKQSLITEVVTGKRKVS